MALTKRIYVDGETIITAQNLNDIQDEIIAHESNKVPINRTVNGKALSSNITLSAADVSAVPTTRKVNNKALSSNITLTSGDIGYNSSTTYASGSIGKAVSDQNGAISDEATTRANADTALQNTLNNIGTVITGEYLSNEIPSGQVIDTMSVTLTNGTWLIFGYFNYSSGFSTGRALSYLLQGNSTLTQLNIDNGVPGGGAFPLSTLIVITDSSSSKTIRMSAYQTSGAQQTISTRRLNAVRIK